MLDDFVIRALVAGVGVALVAGPMGCFLVWRRMAFFGAALAHSALLGIALGLLMTINVNLAVAAVCGLVALMLVGLERRARLPTDTLLGIIAHSMLAGGLVAISLMEPVRVDLVALLFGDILAVTAGDLALIYAGGAAVVVVLLAIWRPLLSLTVHEELARVDGVAVARTKLLFTLLIAVTIAVAMKLVGILLIISMLVVPAAAARRVAATPEAMALMAAAIGCAAVGGGVGASVAWDTPAGPSIVVAATAVFVAALMVPARGGPASP